MIGVAGSNDWIDPTMLLVERARPFIGAYSTLHGELSAVASGQKAMAMHQWNSSAITSRSKAYRSFLKLAKDLGLMVISEPVETESSGDEEIRLMFVVREEERWRVPAFMALVRMRRHHEWSDGAEFLASSLLGYSESEIDEWIRFQRHRSCGWSGLTCYVLMKNAVWSEIEASGHGSLPLAGRGEYISLFYPRGFHVIRLDADVVCDARGLVLARFAMRRDALALFGRSSSSGESPLILGLNAELCARTNRLLVSAFERFEGGKWVARGEAKAGQ